MRRALMTTAALVLALGLSAQARAADDGFAPFWKAYAAAAAKDDQAALKSLTVLPDQLDNRKTPPTFVYYHAHYLKPAQRTCLAKSKPDRSVDPTGVASYWAVCGDLLYGFSMSGGAWRQTDLSPDD
jgi:hypothetical protein